MTTTTDFVPADLDASRWDNLAPLYRTLLDTPVEDAESLAQLVQNRSDLDSAASEAYTNLHIEMTCHTDDATAKEAYLDFVENVQPQLKRVSFELEKKIAASPHAGALDPARYEVLLRDTQANVELFRDENVPLQTEDTKLGQQYSEICGAMMVDFRGEERTLPQMSKFLEETDRATREEAWRAVVERRHRDHERLHEIFEAMVELRHRIGGNAGFDNYRDYMFRAKHRFDYTPADCDAFHRAAEEVCVPLHRKLNAERAAALGVDPLRPWDVAVDVRGRAPLRPFADADELIAKTSKLFHRLDGSLGELFDSLRNGRSLDLESRKGKAPGGYQAYRERSREPFIFMNATGRQDDLDTMIHEAGHAFHSILCEDEPLIHYRNAPLEFAEVASMSMELLAAPYLDEFYEDDDEAARARRVHLEDLVRLLPWIATIDSFQHWIYTHPQHSRAERTARWLELDARFGPAVSWEGLEQYREVSWQRQLHLYEVPFYYIEYGIAQLGALQLWLASRQDQAAAIEAYKRGLSLGGSRPLPELFAASGLTFDFGPDTVKRLIDEVQAELETLPI